ncbi:MAG: alpha/beta hydrolase-fold protein [Polyangiales bacterium]
MGWARDYELGASDHALRTRPLAPEAFLGCLLPARYRRLRDDLAARPYRGLVVVSPYTPDLLDQPERATAYARWIVDVVIPRARRELPVRAERGATGIDGVSLGGLLALEAGFAHPEVFGVVGAVQPAVRRRVPRVLARLREGADPQRVRLLTSDQDYLRPDVRALHRALDARRVAHDLVEVVGPHDYVFNRGAGGLEMLLFHDRALRGEAAR